MLYEFKPEDAFRFARHVNATTYQKDDELIFKECCYCHGQGKGNQKTFSINLKTGQFKCLRASCGAHGNMITLSKDFDFSLGSQVDAYYRAPRKRYRTFVKPKEPIVPKPKAIEYLNSRGISEEIAKRYQVTIKGDSKNILVFTFFDEDGKPTFIKYRKTDFKKGVDKAKEWCEPNCKPILYGMELCNFENDTLILTEGQCFDGDAEVLTPNGWKRLSCYGGEDVLQVDENMQGSFVRPKAYIVKRHKGKMVKVEIGGNYETLTTDDHNLVFINKCSGEIVKRKAGEKISTGYYIPTTIAINGVGYADWTNDMFALYLAVSADGTIDFRKGTGKKKPKSMRYARLSLVLERKIERLRNILNNLGVKYSDNIEGRGYTSICFPCPEWLTSKYLPYGFATETTVEQKRFILSEMVWWDGNHVNGRNQFEYNTIIKHNADVMQLIASSCGYMSTIMSKNNGIKGRIRESCIYKVSILFGKHYVTTQRFEMNKRVFDVDQRVYCVTVDTGMILVRQNDRISVSGNCDTLAVAEAGIENAISVPTGAKGFTWLPFCWNFLNKFERIIIFGDYENGKISLLDELKDRLELTVLHVRESAYKDCKDANELLVKYGKDAVKEAVETAVTIPVKRVIEMADVEDIDIYKIEKLPTGINVVDRLLYGGLPFGGVIVLTGIRGEGKSILASQIAVSALQNDYTVMLYSGELTNSTAKSWMHYQIAGSRHIAEDRNRWGDPVYIVSKTNNMLISEWYRGRLLVYDSDSDEIEDEDESLVKTIKEVVMRNGAQVIILDNLMTAIDLEPVKGDDKYERQSKFVKKLARIGRKFNVLIILVAHKRKTGAVAEVDDNDAVSGSADITNLALVTLTYCKDKELDATQRLLKVSKNRLFGKVNTAGWVMNYDPKSRRIYGTGDDPNAEIGWVNEKEGEEEFDLLAKLGDGAEDLMAWEMDE